MPLVNGNPIDVPNQASSPLAQPAAPSTTGQVLGPPYHAQSSFGNIGTGNTWNDTLSAMKAVRDAYCNWAASCIANNPDSSLFLGAMQSTTMQTVGANCSATSTCPYGGNGIGTITYTLSCAAGYTASGSSCNLTDTTKAAFTSDGTCEVSVSTTGYQVDTRDPDCGNLATQLAANPKTIASAGTDSYGNPVSHSLTNNGDGTQTYTNIVQNADANGNTQTVTRTITYDKNGNVVNQTTVTTPGGSLNVSNPTAPTTTNGTPSTQAAVVNFPSDYARQSQVDTTNQTLTATNGKLDTLHNDLTDTSAGESYNDPSGNTPSDDSIWNKLMAFTPSLDHVKNTTFAAGGVCPTWDADTFFGHLTMNAHCDILEQQRANASTVFTALWTVMATIIFLGA